MKKYELTEEHRAQLPAWRDRWIANAMSTRGMDEAERDIIRTSMRGMYECARLPPPQQIVFVASPLVLRYVAAYAKSGRCLLPTAPTSLTPRAWDIAVGVIHALWGHAATAAAGPRPSTEPDSRQMAWHTDIRRDAVEAARYLTGEQDVRDLLTLAAGSIDGWHGGNQWSGWAAFISFFRHVAKLDIDYAAWAHYEEAVIHGGPSVSYEQFVVISDRPEVLTVDAGNRPHNDTGPFCRWRDGFSLYSVHGVRVPGYVLDFPDTITVDLINAETNAEVRRVMIEKYGIGRYVADSKYEVVDADTDALGHPRRLLRTKDLMVVELTNSTANADGTRRVYHVPVHPELRPLLPNGALGAPQKLTAHAAVASTYGCTAAEYHPLEET